MKKFAVVLTLVATFLTGCAQQGKLQFFELVRNHKELTVETNNSVVASIEDDMKSNSHLSAEDKKSVQNLIDRLKFISRQSEVIFEYVEKNDVDRELMVKLIQSKWYLGK